MSVHLLVSSFPHESDTMRLMVSTKKYIFKYIIYCQIFYITIIFYIINRFSTRPKSWMHLCGVGVSPWNAIT